ncbi:MAG: site-specific integrase [Muribaculaceae bacterium]|nr:site-specific integrase [Muribaculaceae bacterium]
MASIKVKYRPSTVADHEGTIYYQIIHERKPRQLLSNYHVFPSEWDENRSMVVANHKSDRAPYLLSIRERIRWDVERLTKIIRRFDQIGLTYTADDVIDEFNRYADEYSLFNYMENIIIKLKHNGKVRTAETYTATLNSFKKFREDEDIMLDCINSEIMESYEAWQKKRGNSPNTISFYTRILRAVYHRAVEDDVIDNRNPFRHVYTGVDKTVKRALPLQAIKKIRTLDLTLSSELDFARDMFMMSFMLRGMSFIDMAFLRKTDLVGGYVTYRRRKTGQKLIIEWTKEMQVILDKYPENTSDYLLPIIRKSGINERYAYRNVGYNINHNLKRVAEKAGIAIPLTLYVARHSWASIAKAKGIPISVISEGMGHDSEATTQIYLASLDTSLVDKANSLILKSL